MGYLSSIIHLLFVSIYDKVIETAGADYEC